MPELDEIHDLARGNTRARFEQWAKNPKCDANTLSAVANVRMDHVAERLGYSTQFGQSPFAISRGVQFEAWLFRDDASKLRSPLERAGVLEQGSTGLLDLRLKINGGSRIKTIDEALVESLKFLEAVAERRANTASLVAGLTIRIPKGVMLPEATLIIDVLAVCADGDVPALQVGEIKVFPDRGGHTDPQEIGTARAQAGVYRHALEITLDALGCSAAVDLQQHGFLVFTWPGSNSPVVRANEDLQYQAERAARGFDQLDALAMQLLESAEGLSDPEQQLERISHANTSYSETCWQFCDLAARCQDLVLQTDGAASLGDEAARLLAEIPISRALELLHGAPALSEREASIQRTLLEANWGRSE